jgi:hypothetical protein
MNGELASSRELWLSSPTIFLSFEDVDFGLRTWFGSSLTYLLPRNTSIALALGQCSSVDELALFELDIDHSLEGPATHLEIYTSLLCVNKQIRDEIYPILYGSNTFTSTVRYPWFTLPLPRKLVHAVNNKLQHHCLVPIRKIWICLDIATKVQVGNRSQRRLPYRYGVGIYGQPAMRRTFLHLIRPAHRLDHVIISLESERLNAMVRRSSNLRAQSSCATFWIIPRDSFLGEWYSVLELVGIWIWIGICREDPARDDEGWIAEVDASGLLTIAALISARKFWRLHRFLRKYWIMICWEYHKEVQTYTHPLSLSNKCKRRWGNGSCWESMLGTWQID